jgi:hypothetical protein
MDTDRQYYVIFKDIKRPAEEFTIYHLEDFKTGKVSAILFESESKFDPRESFFDKFPSKTDITRGRVFDNTISIIMNCSWETYDWEKYSEQAKKIAQKYVRKVRTVIGYLSCGISGFIYIPASSDKEERENSQKWINLINNELDAQNITEAHKDDFGGTKNHLNSIENHLNGITMAPRDKTSDIKAINDHLGNKTNLKKAIAIIKEKSKPGKKRETTFGTIRTKIANYVRSVLLRLLTHALISVSASEKKTELRIRIATLDKDITSEYIYGILSELLAENTLKTAFDDVIFKKFRLEWVSVYHTNEEAAMHGFKNPIPRPEDRGNQLLVKG